MSQISIKQSEKDYLSEPLQLDEEIAITGKWTPKSPGGLFRKSPDAPEFLTEWEDIHSEAREHEGMLHTEINHAIGEDAILLHHVFKNEKAALGYFERTASKHSEALLKVAKPELHLVRGKVIPDSIVAALKSKGIDTAVGDFAYGFVRDYSAPDRTKAIQVTAKWSCGPNATDEQFEELQHWWREVGNKAHEIEQGMLRYEVYKVRDEKALIIHETFDATDELKFHLTKGTANEFKSHIDKVAAPAQYYFRGPVEWMIRTYSKFMHLPATYTNAGRYFAAKEGSQSSGRP